MYMYICIACILAFEVLHFGLKSIKKTICCPRAEGTRFLKVSNLILVLYL